MECGLYLRSRVTQTIVQRKEKMRSILWVWGFRCSVTSIVTSVMRTPKAWDRQGNDGCVEQGSTTLRCKQSQEVDVNKRNKATSANHCESCRYHVCTRSPAQGPCTSYCGKPVRTGAIIIITYGNGGKVVQGFYRPGVLRVGPPTPPLFLGWGVQKKKKYAGRPGGPPAGSDGHKSAKFGPLSICF